ncbi:MAG: hypothetical protein H7099_18410 [Gemmatimonadaceae bacterium]|nr:hypothetical protein [Gemmatimonadaceae bacterium]
MGNDESITIPGWRVVSRGKRWYAYGAPSAVRAVPPAVAALAEVSCGPQATTANIASDAIPDFTVMLRGAMASV